MKIALVSPYDFAHPGGVCNHISCLEREFTRMGHEVKIIAPASKAIYTFGDRFIPIGSPRPLPVSGSIARITLSQRLSSKIKAVVKREKFDIFHLHEPMMPMLCCTVLRLSDTPTVGTFHASGGKPWYDMFTPLFKFIVLRKWFHKLEGRIAVSNIAMKYVSRHFPGDYTIIPNGVDTKHFSPDVTPIEEYCDGKLNILFVGRMEKRKGFCHLLEAYKLVKKELPDSRLIAVGPGIRLRKKYQKRVKRDGVKDVVFVGYADYKELPRYYKTADIACFPATGWESFGIVLLEAMAVGKPVIASDIEGYAGVVEHGADGLLVPPENAEKMAQAMITLLNDEPLRKKMGARGRAKAQEYDWEQVAQKVLDYYLSILGKTPSSEIPQKAKPISV